MGDSGEEGAPVEAPPPNVPLLDLPATGEMEGQSRLLSAVVCDTGASEPLAADND